ncbi:MAG: ankyrin repeat domain-containing protein [Spirochaetaceae bacterium]|jgi:hypothetical protein|nr:ankyrin repeat domain-containing protein [Spirochaetaceae bacterium]
MKLTIFYDIQDIEFLLSFSSISEEFLIEKRGYAVDQSWEIGSDTGFSEKISSTDNLLIVLTSSSLQCKWVTYVLGYATGKNINIHIYSNISDLPHWCHSFTISKTNNDLRKYYKNYNAQWLKNASIMIANRYLNYLGLDITLTAFVEVVKDGDCLLAGVYLNSGFRATEQDNNGVPLICWAARKRKLNMMKLLMIAGADINAISGDRNDTALIDAVSEDDLEIVSFVLNCNPDLEIKSKNGQTALIIASGHNSEEIVSLLVESGAEKETKDKLGMSALSYAKLQQNQKIIDLLSTDD